MPDWRPHLAARLAALRLSPSREREIVDELSQHLDDRYRELRAAGTADDDAVRLVLDEISDDLLTREMQPLRQATAPPPIVPGAPRGHWGADLWQDLRYAARLLVQGRGWTVIVILLLALGIGANTALFSATNALLLSPLDVRDPGSLVRLRWAGDNDMITDLSEYGYSRPTADGRRTRASFSYALFQELSKDAVGKADLVAAAPVGQVNLVIDGHAELADALEASGNYFQVLGVTAAAGRVFTADDDRRDAPPVAVISARYWQRRFGGDLSAINKVVKVNGVPLTIVGVMPRTFSGIEEPLADPPDLAVPLTLDEQIHASAGRTSPSLLGQPTGWWMSLMGRLYPGVTTAQLQAALEGPFQRTARAGLDGYLQSLSDADRQSARTARSKNEIPSLIVEPGDRGIYDVYTDSVTSARVLFAVVAVILLIVCANVANLMLSRAVGRRKEISVRLSLGATRTRLVRQLLTEALLLSSFGAILGLAVAAWGIRLLPPPASTVGIFHARVLVFTVLTAVLTTLLFGVVPALRATRVDLNAALKETGRSVAGRQGLLARALLVVQVTLSIVLLVGAGLFLRTVANLRHVDVGFDPENLLLVRVMPQATGYDLPRSLELYRTLTERLAALPGARGAALSQPALLSGSTSSTSIYVEGRPAPPPGRGDAGRPSINRLVISPGFFDVYGLPVIRGRGLTPRDDASAPRVTVINETAARQYFPNEDPIGKRFGSRPDHTKDIEIVGIVRDAKYSDLREAAPPTMYDTYMQSPRAVATIAVRTDGAPAALAGAVRNAIHEIDPDLPIAAISTEREQIEKRVAQEKLFAQAYSLFGGIALFLASIGLFGLMSYNVARRTPEMGIRMALGAPAGRVLALIMRESMQLVAIGIVAGLAVAIAAGRLVGTLLFGLAPSDVPTMVTAVVVMAAVAATAAYLPARRAAQVDPNVALRIE